MIGNDIIDLNLARTQSNWKRPGFLQKLFNSEEQQFILNAKNSEFQVWLFWSMKEAVYKAAQRQYNLDRFFGPQQFVCSQIEVNSGEARGVVSFKDSVFRTSSVFTSHKIHTYSSNTEFSLISEAKNSRFSLLQKVSEQADIPLKHLNISNNKWGIPYFTYCGDNLQIPFSLSHHGRYSAYAFSLIMS